MANSLDLYNEFIEFRDALIKDIYSVSVCHETRNGAIVRPVGKISNKKEYNYFQKKINKWHSYVEELCSLDPLRFKPTAIKFHPAPEIITDARRVTYFTGDAVTSKLIEKKRIIFQMEKHLDTLTRKLNAISMRGSADDQEEKAKLNRQLQDITAELDEMLSDSETHYRLRKSGATETVCLYKSESKGAQVKKRAPMAGILFYWPDGQVIMTPSSDESKPRIDRYEFMGVRPIKCSLSNCSGDLFRESEIIAGKSRNPQQDEGDEN